ncbi:MAG: excinuclease ABC subunit UvrA [bacterium]|nr:excinuclease ABC subunit UvrA [bacterium]
MIPERIVIRNARMHNLKGVSLEIPRDRIVVFTGVSGSGKSSLVFDTIYTEAQRQLIETFSSFARARLPKLSKPDVEEIRNISTAIVIDQKRMGTTLRSTVGTATELYTYLRLLFSRCGAPSIGPSFLFGFNHPAGMCPDCKGLGKRIRIDTGRLIDGEKTIREGGIVHPDYKVGAWNWREMVAIGLFDVDKKLKDFNERERADLLYAEGIPVEKTHGAGTYTKNYEGVVRKLERLHINKARDQLSAARRDAYERYFVYSDCDTCGGARINERARSVALNGRTIPELVGLELTDLRAFLGTVGGEVARPMVRKMEQILDAMIGIDVGYLSLNRAVATLSGGESQRVKMARQLGCDLVGLLYILDEPSIGLHPKDIGAMIGMLGRLRDQGNSVLVIEHDPAVIRSADYAVDIGPRAGRGGGEVVYAGPAAGLPASGGITGEYLNRRMGDGRPRKGWTESIEIRGATLHNLKSVSTRIPRGVLTCVTGVAGSGKSSLIHGVFLEEQRDAISVDQSPIGRSSRSNPATYIGFFDAIRREFARATGTSPALFSFNSRGACPECKGLGTISVEMSFLDEVKITCDECGGRRYTEEVLALRCGGKNIHDVLRMTAAEAREFFEEREIARRLRILCEVGLDYLEIGQPLSTLSGGEAQRIKLASELHKRGRIYVMDEPTTGLHMADIERLMEIIERLVGNDNTVVVIEHNLDVIRRADWVIDLGPEGGARGGRIVCEGTPEEIMRCPESHTGRYLREAAG